MKRWKRNLLMPWAGGGANPLAYTNKVLATSPVAYWPFADTSGAVAVNAEGTTARDAAYVGSPTLNQTGIGDGLGAPVFNGTTQFVNVFTASLAGVFNGSEGTFAGWFKMSAAGDWTDGAGHFFGQLRSGSSNLLYIGKTTTNNRIECTYTSGGVQKQIRRDTSNETGWCHVAMTWSLSGDAMKFFFNGVQFSTTQTGLGVWSGALANTVCNVGAQVNTPTNAMKGGLAHWAVWTSALADATIASLASVP